MFIQDRSAAVLVLGGTLGALAIMRSLGRLGIRLGCIAAADAPALLSRYCQVRVPNTLEYQDDAYLQRVLDTGARMGPGTVLIPTSDYLALFVARNENRLAAQFRFQRNSLALVRALADKASMYRLALQHDIPVPHTDFPRTLEDVGSLIQDLRFPAMLKGIDGTRLVARGGTKMSIVADAQTLLEQYQRLEDPQSPNLMIQELIPGDDDQVHIFNGYFDAKSACLAGYTGFKVRQSPIHRGSASLGECRWNEQVADQTIRFMRALRYQGVVDIGYRFDSRDGRYKVLDINPRVGQAFRMFVSRNEMDVVRALYLDLTGQPVAADEASDGRRWMIENDDLESSVHYHREGSLTFWQWLRSFKGLKECAWFNWRDPVPFLFILRRLTRDSLRSVGRRARLIRRPRAVNAGVALWMLLGSSLTEL